MDFGNDSSPSACAAALRFGLVSGNHRRSTRSTEIAIFWARTLGAASARSGSWRHRLALRFLFFVSADCALAGFHCHSQRATPLPDRSENRFHLRRGLCLDVVASRSFHHLQQILQQRSEFQFRNRARERFDIGLCALIAFGSSSTGTLASIVTIFLLNRIVSRLFCSDSR